MTIKHAIPKIEWAIELLYNSVKTGSQLVRNQMSRWQDAASGERERNTDGHKSGGQYVAVLFGLQLPLPHKPYK